jgi:hypothetical protein
MIKHLALLAIFFLVPATVLFAQRGGHGLDKKSIANDSTDQLYTGKQPGPIVKQAKDLLMLQFTYNNWLQKPDSIKTKGFGYGFNSYFCFDFPIKKSKLSFATGLGVSVSVVYLNQMRIANTDTISGAQARFVPDPLDTAYKRYKFTTTYITAPFELRYFSNWQNRNVGFKAAIGMQIGTLLGADAKAVTSVGGVNVKFKTDTKRFVSPWNFAATARVGWGNFSLFMSYNLTNVFKQNEGPLITPASVGICFTGL